MARVKEHSEEWAAGHGLILTESQMIYNLQAEIAELKEELSEANIQIKQYREEVAELEDKIEAYTSQGE